MRIKPTSYNTYSPLQLAFGGKLNISHLRTFDCAVYIPSAPPQCTKLKEYKSPFIIKYV